MGRGKQAAIPGTGQEKILEIEHATHGLIEAREQKKRALEKVNEEHDPKIEVRVTTAKAALRKAGLQRYELDGLVLEIKEKETVIAKRESPEGSGVS